MPDDITLTGLVAGSLLPNLIAVIVQPGWRREVRGLVTFAVCVAAGLAIALLEGRLGDGRDVAAAVVAVLLTSQVLYQALWRPSGIAPAIERATTVPGTARAVRPHH